MVHTVFLKLTKAGSGGDVESLAYLRRAVRNECYSVMRTRRRDIVVAVDAPLLERVQAADDRPDEKLALEQALGQLPAEQREVVHLKVWEGLTFQEIADLTGESLNTAASRYRYAMEKLRAVLAEES